MVVELDFKLSGRFCDLNSRNLNLLYGGEMWRTCCICIAKLNGGVPKLKLLFKGAFRADVMGDPQLRPPVAEPH